MSRTRQIALGGVLAGLAVVLMLLGGVFPLAVYVSPMLASALLLLLLGRLPTSLCLAWYAAVALLSLLLCPDRECAFVFVFLGYYPILRPWLDRLPLPLRIVCKLLLFNAAVAAMYALLLFVFRLDALLAEARELTAVLLVAFVLLGNLAFVLFDRLLARAADHLKRRNG